MSQREKIQYIKIIKIDSHYEEQPTDFVRFFRRQKGYSLENSLELSVIRKIDDILEQLHENNCGAQQILKKTDLRVLEQGGLFHVLNALIQREILTKDLSRNGQYYRYGFKEG